MTTAAPTFSKSGLYNSDLAKHGEIAVMFTGTPRDSQYKGRMRFVGLKVYGDETAYTLNIENAQIEAAIVGTPLNTWVSVLCGGKGEEASMRVQDINGNPVFGGVPASEVAQPPEPPKHHNTAPQNPVSMNGDPIVQRACALTAQAVGSLKLAGIVLGPDEASKLYCTHYIQASR